MRKPTNWTEAMAGRLTDVYGDHEQVIDYLEGERAGWKGGSTAPVR